MIIKSVSGIRGIVGTEFTPEYVTRYSAAFGIFSGRGRVVIGRDSRRSGEMLRDAAVAGLLSVGCEVIDLGIVPTPTVLYNVKSLGADGGMVITASHNPAEWNALKLVNKEGIFLSGDEGRKLEEIMDGEIERVDWRNIKDVIEDNKGVERHISGVLDVENILVDEIRRSGLRVALDCVNGAAFSAYPDFLRSLGCDVVEVFCEATGDFRRNPEPRPENLSALEHMVRDTGADVGFATDADGDRLSVVSEEGVAIGEEYTITMAMDYWFSRVRGVGVVNYSTTSMVDFVAKKHNTRVFRAKVGEANVVQRMKEVEAIIGGEGNGGVILPDVHYTRDAMVGMALILSLLAHEKKKVSELVNAYPSLYIMKEVKRFDSLEEREKFYQDLLDTFKKKDGVDYNDGIKIFFEEGWLHIRKSGTEPIIRFIAEGEDREWVEDIVNKYAGGR